LYPAAPGKVSVPGPDVLETRACTKKNLADKTGTGSVLTVGDGTQSQRVRELAETWLDLHSKCKGPEDLEALNFVGFWILGLAYGEAIR
jgi:hypothetical protein